MLIARENHTPPAFGTRGISEAIRRRTSSSSIEENAVNWVTQVERGIGKWHLLSIGT